MFGEAEPSSVIYRQETRGKPSHNSKGAEGLPHSFGLTYKISIWGLQSNSYTFIHYVSWIWLDIFNLSLHYKFGDRKRETLRVWILGFFPGSVFHNQAEVRCFSWKLMLIRGERPTGSRHLKRALKWNWTGPHGAVRRHSSPLDSSRGKGRAWGPCMRIRTLVTPICSSIPLSLPHRCHGDMSGITVSLIPQRKQYSVWTLVSWPLRPPVCRPHPPQSRASYKRQHFTRGSATLPIIDLSPFYPSAPPTCLFLKSHHSLNAVGLLLAWS